MKQLHNWLVRVPIHLEGHRGNWKASPSVNLEMWKISRHLTYAPAAVCLIVEYALPEKPMVTGAGVILIPTRRELARVLRRRAVLRETVETTLRFDLVGDIK